MAEGFLEITGVTVPEGAHVGDEVEVIVHGENTGADDDFRVELIGDVEFVGRNYREFPLSSGYFVNVYFKFIMPDKDVSIEANSYHWTAEGWVWDVTSVWNVNWWQ